MAAEGCLRNRERVSDSCNGANREAKIKEVQRQAEQEYISTYQGLADLRELELKPYDAENGVFLITSKSLGQLIVPVPRTNNEARIFESSWVGMQFKNPKYFIDNDHLALANLTLLLLQASSISMTMKQRFIIPRLMWMCSLLP